MHELAIARDLLETIERTLDGGTARVVRVSISVGSATGIMAEALRFSFRVVGEGTRAENAELAVTTVPSRCRCVDCANVFNVDGLIGRCPDCGRLGGELLSGNELILRAIEVVDV